MTSASWALNVRDEVAIVGDLGWGTKVSGHGVQAGSQPRIQREGGEGRRSRGKRTNRNSTAEPPGQQSSPI